MPNVSFCSCITHQALEHAFKTETIGLVTKEEFVKKRATLAERCVESLLLAVFDSRVMNPKQYVQAVPVEIMCLGFTHRMEEEQRKKAEAEAEAIEREKERKRQQKMGASSKKLSFALDVSSDGSSLPPHPQAAH